MNIFLRSMYEKEGLTKKEEYFEKLQEGLKK